MVHYLTSRFLKQDFVLLLLLCTTKWGLTQQFTPLNYDNNLSLFGKPSAIDEYYYDRMSQLRMLFYKHQFAYDSLTGKIKQHTKSNIGLYENPLDLFINFLPAISTTTYNFDYDDLHRISSFSKIVLDSTNNTVEQWLEEWKYEQNMLIERNYYQWTEGIPVIKNPSFRRKIHRDEANKVVRIEKESYSFLDRSLSLSEIIEFRYVNEKIDSIFIFKRDDAGILQLSETQFDFQFARYDDQSTDSMLFRSYSSLEQGQLYEYSYNYDDLWRMTRHEKTRSTGERIMLREWNFDSLRTTFTFNEEQKYITFYDETGSFTHQENYSYYSGEWYLDEVPLEVIERTVENGKITFAGTKLWDQDNPFYRKKADFEYFYDIVSANERKEDFVNLSVWPNPSNGYLNLSHAENISTLVVIDLTGRKEELPLSGSRLDLSLPDGLYLLEIGLKNGEKQLIRFSVNQHN